MLLFVPHLPVDVVYIWCLSFLVNIVNISLSLLVIEYAHLGTVEEVLYDTSYPCCSPQGSYCEVSMLM